MMFLLARHSDGLLDKNFVKQRLNGIKLRKSRITHSVVWDFFYGKVLTCQSKNAAALATDLFIEAAKAALVIRNHLFARRTPHE